VEQGVPFVSLRPGAFLDAITQMGGDPFAKRRPMWFGSATIDVAGVEGERIDIGWDRPVSMQEIARISGHCWTGRSGCAPFRPA
jgi:hypothetical protein